jgi:cobalamin biosynthesis protein CobT
MMREGLLKENIDGEALDWAHQAPARRGRSSGAS